MEKIKNVSQSVDNTGNGWINGLIGVIIFSGSLPATRMAIADFDPVFLTAGRAAIAGVLAACSLLIFRQRLPKKIKQSHYLLWQSEL